MSRIKQGALTLAVILTVAFSGCVASTEVLKLTQTGSYVIEVEIQLRSPYPMGRYYLNGVRVYDTVTASPYYDYPIEDVSPSNPFDNRWGNNPWTFTIKTKYALSYPNEEIFVELYIIGPTGPFTLAGSFQSWLSP